MPDKLHALPALGHSYRPMPIEDAAFFLDEHPPGTAARPAVEERTATRS